ncbi:hypothetical protein N7474_008596 [Penicillium riverlandense]|uniref:uncharacterized protein n=1 Tax=Penicillium riverlandense TaxID=1903569 RepID=UPI00254856E7|nr:uncharacterized protein N7474_008596 [Penicillium riverlandense]KAJ5812295.1 hypothetical protein N7474_008596 [Penicillium riverlandense]
MLLDHGLDVNAYGNFISDIFKANTYDGLERILQYHTADVNAQDRKHSNALYAVSSVGHERLVQMLLDLGANAASTNGYGKVVQMLLDHGADGKSKKAELSPQGIKPL